VTNTGGFEPRSNPPERRAQFDLRKKIDTIAALLQVGAGTPEGAVAAPVGTLFLRTDGGTTTTLYVKESGVGNTGWVAK
jgi:hypothetical protein